MKSGLQQSIPGVGPAPIEFVLSNPFGLPAISATMPVNLQLAIQVAQLKQAAPSRALDAIGYCLTEDELYRKTMTLLEEHPRYQSFYRENPRDDSLRSFYYQQSIDRVLLLHLTLMSRLLPSYFDHCLFSAWACNLISRELKLDFETSYEVTLCGLCHDIGLLYIPPEVLSHQTLSSGHWAFLQSHVIIGSLIIDCLDRYSTALSKGVLEHHERQDRSGYPSRKSGEKLGLLGQISGCTDLLATLCSASFNPDNAVLHQGPLSFRMHQGAYSAPVYDAVARLLARLRPPDKDCFVSVGHRDRLLRVNRELCELSRGLDDVLIKKYGLNRSLKGDRVLAMAQSISQTLLRSGIVSEQMDRMLRESHAPEQSNTLLEIDAMQRETLWLFKRLSWNIESYLGHPSSTVTIISD